ncbi:hypothetical protein T01_2322 [Trichinella spiralis]|uniref:Uncharacterized protein n=1 Tax=Trichinella spiralis TaxID=6334 RepID=A0A0V0YU97_TRISP|nr:hypothetical protein T01_2322 [Trichinella spiralis]
MQQRLSKFEILYDASLIMIMIAIFSCVHSDQT